jgi:hypothetical protein
MIFWTGTKALTGISAATLLQKTGIPKSAAISF